MPNTKDKQTGKQKAKWHHFDLGETNVGQVGISGEIRATSRDQAARILQDYLEQANYTIELQPPQRGDQMTLYVNPKRVSREDFTSSRPVEEGK